MKRISTVLTTLVLLFSLFSCGGKGGNSPVVPEPEPTPTPTPKPEVPVWNKDRTLEFLVVSNDSQNSLFSDKAGYRQLADRLKDQSAYSAVLLVNANAAADGQSPAMVVPPAAKLFHYFNLSTYQGGVAYGNLLLTKEYNRKYENKPVGKSYLMTLNTDLKATSSKQLNYNLNLGIITIRDNETLQALERELPKYVSGTNEIMLIGSIAKNLVATFPKVAGYEFKQVSPNATADYVTFLFAKTSYLHRETAKLFELTGATGYSVKVEAGVKR